MLQLTCTACCRNVAGSLHCMLQECCGKPALHGAVMLQEACTTCCRNVAGSLHCMLQECCRKPALHVAGIKPVMLHETYTACGMSLLVAKPALHAAEIVFCRKSALHAVGHLLLVMLQQSCTVMLHTNSTTSHEVFTRGSPATCSADSLQHQVSH